MDGGTATGALPEDDAPPGPPYDLTLHLWLGGPNLRRHLPSPVLPSGESVSVPSLGEESLQEKVLREGLEKALKLLEKKKCANFFKNAFGDATDILTSLWVGNRIRYANLGVGSENEIVGAITVGFGYNGFIRINTMGYFLRPTHTAVQTDHGETEISVTGMWRQLYGLPGLNDDDVLGITPLHELAHALNRIPADRGDSEEGERNTRRIIDNCIK